MEIEGLDGYTRENWDSIREQIRKRGYKLQPVRRVEILKPNGSKRKLGIPTVMDRVIQQAIAQVISPMREPLFSDSSYGFRPNRSCEMAVREMLVFLNGGYEWIVDIDMDNSSTTEMITEGLRKLLGPIRMPLPRLGNTCVFPYTVHERNARVGTAPGQGTGCGFGTGAYHCKRCEKP